MRKIRIYLETSPVIMIQPDQNPIHQAITKEFFRVIVGSKDEYELLISPVTADELDAGNAEQREYSNSLLSELSYTELPQSAEAENLARVYAANNVLGQKHTADLMHVAYAVVARCDYIVTWNMKHLAKARTMDRVNRVNGLENYANIVIVTPQHFTGEISND